MITKIRFTAVTIAWTEGGILHLRIRASAESKISIAWGDGRSIMHFFNNDNEEMEFRHNYYPNTARPPQEFDGNKFYVEICAETPDCRILGFHVEADMDAIDLDLSNCPELEYLHYSANNINYMKTLDLSCNTALKYLNCYLNEFDRLDLSNNTALEELYCNGNRLRHLSLYNNCNLKYLDCTYNSMKKIFICYATQLIGADIEEGNNLDEASKMRIQDILAENAENN